MVCKAYLWTAPQVRALLEHTVTQLEDVPEGVNTNFVWNRLEKFEVFFKSNVLDIVARREDWLRLPFARLLVNLTALSYALIIQKQTQDDAQDDVSNFIVEWCSYLERILFMFFKFNFECDKNPQQTRVVVNPETQMVLRSLKALKADHKKELKSKKKNGKENLSGKPSIGERLVFECTDEKLKESLAILDLYRKERNTVNK